MNRASYWASRNFWTHFKFLKGKMFLPYLFANQVGASHKFQLISDETSWVGLRFFFVHLRLKSISSTLVPYFCTHTGRVTFLAFGELHTILSNGVQFKAAFHCWIVQLLMLVKSNVIFFTRKQSNWRNLVFKKSKIVLNLLTVHYFNSYHNITVL